MNSNEQDTRLLNSLDRVKNYLEEMIYRTRSTIIIVVPDFYDLPLDVIREFPKKKRMKIAANIPIEAKEDVKELLQRKNIEIRQRFERDAVSVARENEEIMFAPMNSDTPSEEVQALISTNHEWVQMLHEIIGPLMMARTVKIKKNLSNLTFEIENSILKSNSNEDSMSFRDGKTWLLKSHQDLMHQIEEMLKNAKKFISIVIPDFQDLPLNLIKRMAEKIPVAIIARILQVAKNDVRELLQLNVEVRQRPEMDLYAVVRDNEEIGFAPVGFNIQEKVESTIALISTNPMWIKFLKQIIEPHIIGRAQRIFQV